MFYLVSYSIYYSPFGLLFCWYRLNSSVTSFSSSRFVDYFSFHLASVTSVIKINFSHPPLNISAVIMTTTTTNITLLPYLHLGIVDNGQQPSRFSWLTVMRVNKPTQCHYKNLIAKYSKVQKICWQRQKSQNSHKEGRKQQNKYSEPDIEGRIMTTHSEKIKPSLLPPKTYRIIQRLRSGKGFSTVVYKDCHLNIPLLNSIRIAQSR